MKISTRFEPGDSAYCLLGDEGVQRLTVGQAQVIVTDSPGVPGSIFDNYKPQSNYEERYMCVETGIGSGSVFTLGEGIFGEIGDAKDALAKWEKQYRKVIED